MDAGEESAAVPESLEDTSIECHKDLKQDTQHLSRLHWQPYALRRDWCLTRIFIFEAGKRCLTPCRRVERTGQLWKRRWRGAVQGYHRQNESWELGIQVLSLLVLLVSSSQCHCSCGCCLWLKLPSCLPANASGVTCACTKRSRVAYSGG